MQRRWCLATLISRCSIISSLTRTTKPSYSLSRSVLTSGVLQYSTTSKNDQLIINDAILSFPSSSGPRSRSSSTNNTKRTSKRQQQQQQQQQQQSSVSGVNDDQLQPPWRSPLGVPRGYWEDPENHKRFFDWAAQQLRVEQPDDWYKITVANLSKLGGGGLLSMHYDNSLLRALANVYPETEWLPWKSSSGVPSNYWRDPENHRRFFDWAAKQLSIQQPEDWYRISYNDMKRLGGAGLIDNYYDGSFQKALAAVYPDIEWLPWRFATGVHRGFWQDTANHKRFFDWAAKQLGVRQPEDWYQITREEMAQRLNKYANVAVLINHYGGSLTKALMQLYPSVEWIPWKFASGVPRGFWADPANRRWFFEWAAKQLGVERPEDWYRTTREELNRLGGSGLLDGYYDSSLLKALCAMYPEVDWLPWRFANGVPRGYWSDTANHYKFFEWAAERMAIRKPDDWLKLTHFDIANLGGKGLLHGYYDDSLVLALLRLYPEYAFESATDGGRRLASAAPSHFWDDPSTHRKFFDWAAKRLAVATTQDWFKVSRDDFLKLDTMQILKKHYGGSLPLALSKLFRDDELEVLPWKFASGVPNGFWNDPSNHRRFFDWAARQLNIDSNNAIAPHEGWYEVSRDDVARLGGAGLLISHYDGSLMKALAAVYPHVEWQPWRFRRFVIPSSSSSSSSAYASSSAAITGTGTAPASPPPAPVSFALAEKYIEFLAKELNITSLDEWYRVTPEHIRQQQRGRSGYNIIAHHGGLCAVLKRLYPEHDWNETRFHVARGKRASQRSLRLAVQKLFPNEELMEEYMHPNVRFDDTSDAEITLDLCIPSLSLAFEYHGEQHYRDVHWLGTNASTQQERDERKAAACARAGITLIVVPYWWDRTTESIADAIRRVRPDLLANLTWTDDDSSPRCQ